MCQNMRYYYERMNKYPFLEFRVLINSQIFVIFFQSTENLVASCVTGIGQVADRPITEWRSHNGVDLCSRYSSKSEKYEI